MRTTDLESWQRLAPMALLFLVINGGAKFVRDNLYAFAGAGAGFAFLDQLGLREFLLGGLVALLAAVLIAMVYYRRFRYRLEGDAIRVRRGIIESKDLRIRFARVQNVGLSQPFYFRPFDLVRFELETPGAESTEVSLPGIRREVALALRDRVARYSPAADVHSDREEDVDEGSEARKEQARTEPVDGSVLIEPKGWRLFAHGLVSNQVWLLAGIAAWASSTLWDRIEAWMASTGVSEVLRRVLELGWFAALAMVLLLVVLLFALSGLLAVIRFHGFVLRDLGDRFLAVGGLLDRREQNIRREKLTGLTLYQTALGRLIDQWYLVGKQAGSKEFEVNPSARHFLVPGLRRRSLTVVGRLMPGFSMPDRIRPVSRRLRTLLWVRITAAVLLPLGLAWWFQPETRPLLAIVPLVLLLVLWLVHRSWRCWGWQVDRGRCWIRQGLFGVRLDAFELSMVQQLSVVRTPYQRRHGLATLRMTLPQGQVSIPFMTLEDAAELANQATHAAETARFHRV